MTFTHSVNEQNKSKEICLPSRTVQISDLRQSWRAVRSGVTYGSKVEEEIYQTYQKNFEDLLSGHSTSSFTSRLMDK